MIDFSNMAVSSDTLIIDAMSLIDRNSRGIVFICENGILQATLTDGDIRRHILQKGSLDIAAGKIANYDFKCATDKHSHEDIQAILQKWEIKCLPIIDHTGRLIDVAFLHERPEVRKTVVDVPVVIMAGGKGTRLYPYTKILPKPLIPVGDLTITEHILGEFSKYGCERFTMIVNHKKNMIKAFFADEETNYQVEFIDEEQPLGTGGGLKLLTGRIKQTFFMTNCDVLILEDYGKILNYHRQAGNMLTMICTTKKITIPYGTVEIDEKGAISGLTEKPSFSFLTNTGFYVIEPEFLDFIPENTFIHITDIIQKCIDQGKRIGIYPISEYQWSDMGQYEELEKMKEKMGL